MDREPSERADVCVIGAGPAGALIASQLASDGQKVVVLEAGPRFDKSKREQQMEAAIRPGDHGSVWEMGGDRDAFSANGERHYPLNISRVKGVGGSTLHWQGMVMRLHPSDFDGSHDTDDPAWPISYDDLRPYYADAERALGVAGDADNPFTPPRDGAYPLPGFPPSYSDSLFAEACERLGITMHSVPNARNSEPYDDRGPCVGYGTCQPVCPSGAKYDASVHIEDAEAEGTRLIDRAPVQRLETDDDGRVEAAVYATPDGTEHRQTAREFVIAAGGVETPRLLLLSASDDHPDGLANSSGLVGHYFMDHLFAGAGGTLDRETRQNHVGFLTSECHQFYDDPGQAVERVADGETIVGPTAEALSPLKLEFLNYAGPSPVELALSGEEWGDTLLSSLRESYGNSIAMGGLVGQPPRKENRVTLDTSTTDDHGNPVPDIQWSWGDRLERSLSRANEIQHAVLSELGVDISWTVGPADTGPAYHHMGTTRMGTDPQASVVDPQLRTHDVANLSIASSSVFVTAGSMNPTLTIAALALKCADHVSERL
ncbi:GMC family oxidoreductase [Haloarcula japonica]|uniref:Glucose-methanol-choline family oxidoreductase n=1 Tax=Haloarcula japonica (strain ATCC 49778 / DSM 6131 / JCM 7785 / NBRC 101032 / NCIMB 13157 / TR-1) TaxID=1227453 RepID=M0L976_HALJT|nr:GMC family oxidoreductase [Haloarcula japonica]EMA29643.1 glucose-methanol-choline family oxidoreductase [Haloarcula japonica DSM 6131]